MLRYPTLVGRPTLIKLLRDDGEPIPMGAQVLDAAGASLTQVGQSGRTFLRGLEGSGQLLIKWGSGADQQCLAPYNISTDKPAQDEYYELLKLPCKRLSASQAGG